MYYTHHGVLESHSGALSSVVFAVFSAVRQRFLLSPCPRAAGVVQCYIRRNKTRSNKLFPEYSLFMKVCAAGQTASFEFTAIRLMCGRVRVLSQFWRCFGQACRSVFAQGGSQRCW